MKQLSIAAIALFLAVSPITVQAQTNEQTVAEMRENLALAVIALTQNGEFSIELLNTLIEVYNVRMGTVGVTLGEEETFSSMPEPEKNPTKERLIELDSLINDLNDEHFRLRTEADEYAKERSGRPATQSAFRKQYLADTNFESIELELEKLRLERRDLSLEYCGRKVCILN